MKNSNSPHKGVEILDKLVQNEAEEMTRFIT
jgi:hypothetical protein